MKHLIATFATLTLLCVGCVERTVRIETDPPGAIVVLNDEEVPGVSPVKTSFTWYGTYDVIIRKPGYETLHTTLRLDPPWYQLPPFDLFAECFVPGMIHDDHVAPVYTLRPAQEPTSAELIDRATELRTRTIKD